MLLSFLLLEHFNVINSFKERCTCLSSLIHMQINRKFVEETLLKYQTGCHWFNCPCVKEYFPTG